MKLISTKRYIKYRVHNQVDEGLTDLIGNFPLVEIKIRIRNNSIFDLILKIEELTWTPRLVETLSLDSKEKGRE